MRNNEKLYSRVLISVAVILFLVLVSSTASASFTETRITTNTAAQRNPSIWSNYIVWQDARNGGSDIYLQNMATKVQTRVTSGVDAENPCVSGDKIVWQDKRNGNWDIYMYEISLKKTTRITLNTADQTEPGAYGNYIVWTDTRNGGSDIYLQNLATKVQTKVATNGHSPSIYDNKIVWINGDINGGTNKILMYNINTKQTTTIINNEKYLSDLSIYNNQIMYNVNYDGFLTCLYDFVAKKAISLHYTYIEDPAMYSNKIVFADYRNRNFDIYMIQN